MTTTRHTIRLGDGKRVPVGEYVKGVRRAIANPGATFSRSLTGVFPATGEEIRQQFGQMVTDHCNRGLVIADRCQTDKAIARRYTAECRREYWR